MVVGTDVEEFVVLAVVPTQVFSRFFPGGKRRRRRLGKAAFDLRQQPTSRDDGMGFEKLRRRIGIHLRGNDAGQISLHIDLVDGDDALRRADELQGALEALVFVLLPMEIHTDSYLLEVECAFRCRWREKQFVIELSVENNLIADEQGTLFTREEVACLDMDIRLAETKLDRFLCKNTYLDNWSFHLLLFSYFV